MNNLREKLVESLEQKAVKACRDYKRSEAELISALQAIDKERAYLDLKYKSLFDYATKKLRLSRDVAYFLITIARKSVEVPALKQAIERGSLSVSNARRIAPLLSQANHEKWIEMAETLSMQSLEKQIAKEHPLKQVSERAKYVSGERVQLTLTVSEEILAKFKRVQDLVSQKQARTSSLEDALGAALDAYLEKHDPVKKAERASARRKKVAENAKGKTQTTGTKTELETETVTVTATASETDIRIPVSDLPAKKVVARRLPLRAKLLHELHLRDKGACTHTENQKRCGSTRWIHFHHITPLSEGGSDTIENLITLCSAHHRFLHRHQ